jgi:uncharacterized protein (DUF952 family)
LRAKTAEGLVTQLIYKILSAVEWGEAEAKGVFAGAGIDVSDGFIHFSTGTQAQETAVKHFAGRSDLVLVAVDADSLGAALKWEVARGSQLFPHLYGSLPTRAVLWVKALPVGADGSHVFPELT